MTSRTRAVCIAPPPGWKSAVEAQVGLAMVDAARAAGARKFLYSGVIHPSIAAMTNHAAKLPVEEALYGSELDFTVLQPARFMQNFAQSWDDIVENDCLAQPYALSSKMCSVDYRDVADVAAMAMTGDELSYGTFELCAPGMQDTQRPPRSSARYSGDLSPRCGRHWTSSPRDCPRGPSAMA